MNHLAQKVLTNELNRYWHSFEVGKEQRKRNDPHNQLTDNLKLYFDLGVRHFGVAPTLTRKRTRPQNAGTRIQGNRYLVRDGADRDRGKGRAGVGVSRV